MHYSDNFQHSQVQERAFSFLSTAFYWTLCERHQLGGSDARISTGTAVKGTDSACSDPSIVIN